MAHKKAAHVASLQEVELAQAFLRTLGANWHNSLLILAVAAWFDVLQPKGLKHVVGNDIFGAYLKGQRFHTLEQSVVAFAKMLLKPESSSVYDPITDAIKHVPVKGNALIVAAARNATANDFLVAIALSNWDTAHFMANGQNILYNAYTAYTGLTLPQAATKAAAAQKQPPPPPPALGVPNLTQTFMDGFAIEGFYRARHPLTQTGE